MAINIVGGGGNASMPEWSKGDDLRSSGFGRVGSNPTGCINLYFYHFALVAQLVRASVL